LLEVIHVFENIKGTLIDDKTNCSSNRHTGDPAMNTVKTKKKTTGKVSKTTAINSDSDQQLLNELNSIGKNGKNILRIEVDSRRR